MRFEHARKPDRLFGVVVIAPQSNPSVNASPLGAPVATTRPHAFTLHGDTRVDSYTWLRDKSNPDVVAYLGAENDYTAQAMAATKPLQSTLYAEMLRRIKQTDSSVPYRRGAYEYYSRTEEGRQYAIHCRRVAGAASEAVLLDLNALAAGETFLALGDFVVSDDGNLLAYTLDITGYRQYTLYVKDLRDGAFAGEPIERVDAVVWAADNRTLVYCTQDAVTKRSDTIWRRAVDARASELVVHEADEIFDLGLERTRDGSAIIITSAAKDTTECRYVWADRAGDAPVVFDPRRDGVRYALDVRAERFYIRTNDGAPDFAVYSTSIASPERARWTPVVEQRTGTTIMGFELFADFACVIGRRDGLASIEVLDATTNALTALTFDEADYVVDFADNYEFATSSVRITYESMITPRSTYDVDVRSGGRTLRKRTDVPGYEYDAYAIERRFETARDGTLIPVSIVQKKNVAHDGSAPMLLYGYGSYGISIDPSFSAARLPLLDRGVIFAIAHIRGGGEYGEAWRLAGNLMQKRTTFTDFIDVADGLVAANYTSHERLVIEGASAGGLLVGAVANARPDVCRAVIARVPFVDVLTTMLDATLPLTTGEYREWGDPNDAAAYAYMRSYSPLDHVAQQPYPAMLIEVGFNDSQVPYWEGAKFAAKVRAHTTSGKPILLKTNMQAGHGGSSGRYTKLREIAFAHAFLLWQVGITQ